MLERLVYVSTLRPHVGVEDILELTAKAAEFNRSRDISGVLAIENGRVCQILEGQKENLDELFASIRRDPRHFDVLELYRSPIDVPHFEGWGMAQKPMVDLVILAYSL